RLCVHAAGKTGLLFLARLAARGGQSTTSLAAIRLQRCDSAPWGPSLDATGLPDAGDLIRLVVKPLTGSRPQMVEPRRQRLATAREVLPVTLSHIKSAEATIRGAVALTECNESKTLGELCGCNIWLKFENLQFTSTFKERGALNRLCSLS